MSWTPPSKFTVVLSFLLFLGGLFIIVDMIFSPFAGTPILPVIGFLGFSYHQSWIIIALVLFFLSWFLFYLGVQLKGL
jgi:uncharacterized protein YggT (Ycf19 family)